VNRHCKINTIKKGDGSIHGSHGNNQFTQVLHFGFYLSSIKGGGAIGRKIKPYTKFSV
jgi:hypothetical protein